MRNSTLQYLFPSSERGPRSPLQFLLDILFFLLFFVTPILISVSLKQVFNAPKYLFVGAIATMMMATWVVSVLYRRELRIPRQPTLLLFGLLILWEFLTISESTGWDLSLREFSVQLSLFLICLVAAANVRDRERIENLLHFAIAAGVVAAGFGMLQYYKLDEKVFPFFSLIGLDLRWLVLPQKPEEYLKIYSTMGHRNYLAGYLICVIPIVLGRLLSSISVATQDSKYRWVAWRQTFVYGTSFLLMFTVVLLTHTRGSWVGLSAGLTCFAGIIAFKFRSMKIMRACGVVAVMLVTAVIIFGSKSLSPAVIALCAVGGFGASCSLAFCRDYKTLGKALAITLIIAILCGAFFRLITKKEDNPLSRMHQSALSRLAKSFDLRYGSAFQRVLIWSTAWAIITENMHTFLFGRGFGSFGLNYMPFQAKLLAKPEYKHFMRMVNKSIYAHSEYLHFWSEIGLIGLLLMACTAAFFYYTMFRYIARCEVNYQNLLLVGMLCATISVLVHNIFSFSLHLPYTSSLFYCLVAFCLRYAGTLELVLQWGDRKMVHSSFAVGDGWLGLSIIPLTKERFRCWIGWFVEPSAGSVQDDLVVRLGAPGGKTVEKALPRPHDEPVVIERQGDGRGYSLQVFKEKEYLGGAALPKTRDVNDPMNVLITGVGLLFVVFAVSLSFDNIGRMLSLDYNWRNGFPKFRMRHFEESIIDFNRALANDPERGEVLFDYGRALMDSNRNAMAIKQFERAKRNFVDPANDHNIALCYYKDKKIDMAEKHYRQALELNPIYEQSLSNLAFYLVSKNRLDEARDLLKLGMRYYPGNATFFSSAGVLEARTTNHAKAIELLRKSLELDGNNVSAKVNLATILFNEKRYQEALDMYEEILKVRPKDALVMRKYLGTKACVLRERLQVKKDDGEAIRALAITYAQLGQMAVQYCQEAVRLLRAYLTQVPQDGEVRYYLGLSLQQMGYYSEALSEVRAAKAIMPADSALSKSAGDTIRILQLKQRMAPPKTLAPSPTGSPMVAPPPTAAPAPTVAPPPSMAPHEFPHQPLETQDPIMGPLLAPLQNDHTGGP